MLPVSKLLFSATEVAPLRELVPAESPAPVLAPEPELPPPPPRRNYVAWSALAVGALILLTLVARLFNSAEKSASTAGQLRTAVVEKKDFVQSLRVHGIVEAVESHTINAPRLSGQGLGTLIITKLVKNGSTVHRGDVLVEFDRQAQLKNVIDRQAEYRDLMAQISIKQADQAALMAANETELKQAEDAQQTAELEMKKNEIVSRIDAEKNQQNLDQAKATVKQLRETFALKRQAANAELKVLEIQRDRALTAMRWAEGNTEKMVIRSSIDGIAVVSSTWKAGSMSDVQEGDEVRAGFPFLQVVDSSRMLVRAKVNQADIGRMRSGLHCNIGLDAYPELSFHGKLESIATVAQISAFSSTARSFTVLFSIDGSDAKLLPDLSAAVDVELNREPDVLVAPRDVILNEGGHYYVRVKNGSGFDKREVKLGQANDVEQVIASGVDKGSVLLRNPTS